MAPHGLGAISIQRNRMEEDIGKKPMLVQTYLWGLRTRGRPSHWELFRTACWAERYCQDHPFPDRRCNRRSYICIFALRPPREERSLISGCHHRISFQENTCVWPPGSPGIQRAYSFPYLERTVSDPCKASETVLPSSLLPAEYRHRRDRA